MASYPIPPWLHPYGDPGELYLQSQRISAGIQEAQQRLEAQQQQAAIAAQLRSDAVHQRALEQQQKIAIEKARLDATTGLRQQSIDIARQRTDLVAQRAAQQFAAQQQFSRRIAAEGSGNAAQIALSTPGLGLSGQGIASLSRAANPPDLNMEPQWVPDPETGKLIGYNRRTGTPHYRPAGRAEIPGSLTQKEREQLRNLRTQIPQIDKALNEPIAHRAELRSEEEIKALPKDRQEGARRMKEDAMRLREKRDRIEKQIDDIIGSPESAGGGAVSEVPKSVQGGSVKSQKAKRANQLAEEHPDWTREQILDAVAKEFK